MSAISQHALIVQLQESAYRRHYECLALDPYCYLQHPLPALQVDQQLGAMLQGQRRQSGGTGKRSTALPEIAEDDVYHGAAPVGAAAAHRGLAKCAATAYPSHVLLPKKLRTAPLFPPVKLSYITAPQQVFQAAGLSNHDGCLVGPHTAR